MTDFEYQTESDALLARLPQEFRNIVANMAWEQGHSAGQAEVINVLRGLVGDLESPCEKFEARVKDEARSQAAKDLATAIRGVPA